MRCKNIVTSNLEEAGSISTLSFSLCGVNYFCQLLSVVLAKSSRLWELFFHVNLLSEGIICALREAAEGSKRLKSDTCKFAQNRMSNCSPELLSARRSSRISNKSQPPIYKKIHSL